MAILTVMTVNFVFAQSEDTTAKASTYLIGDLNGDLNFDSIDFGLMRKYLLGMIKSFEVEDDYMRRC